MPLKIMITAGEPSGDLHAANLMKQIKQIEPDTRFIGIGGERMSAEGLESIVPMKEMSVVGFWEVVKRYRFFREVLNRAKELIKNEKPDVYIPVDYPGFNMNLAYFAKSAGTKVIYYIAPQLWAWGSGRAKKLKGSVDKLLVVFPFEEEYFGKFGLDAEFTGHPLLDISAFEEMPRSPEDRENLIALLPGSRQQEIERHLPLFEESCSIISREIHDVEFGLAKSSLADESVYLDFLKNNKTCTLYASSSDLMHKAKAGIVKTGTSNLEACLAGMPFVMVYKASPFTYFMGKRLVNLPYLSIINILLNEAVIDELIQKDASARKIATLTKNIYIDSEKQKEIYDIFMKVRNLLGKGGGSEKAARIILSQCGRL
ncbi:MAG: lipid-A-disaccharide synthase [Candidatus Kapaibacterium sp.]